MRLMLLLLGGLLVGTLEAKPPNVVLIMVDDLSYDAIGDAYGGWIVVSGEEELRIPVRLVVLTQP